MIDLFLALGQLLLGVQLLYSLIGILILWWIGIILFIKRKSHEY